MSTNSIILTTIVAYCLGSVLYVFKFRGQERYANFTEYLRKGWLVFAPFNSFLYIFTKKKAAKPIMDLNDFPEMKILEENWETIKEEAINLKKHGYFSDITNPDNASYYDIGFRTFYKYGWSKFYLNWYGSTHESAKKLCPKTLEIINKVPYIKGAMFSLLPKGSQLTRHLDPAASALRFHLGLDTPNNDNAFINVDGTSYSWRDGEGFLFDETYLHFAKNNTEKDRLILMCEVDRPLSLPGMIFNKLYQLSLKLTVVPNTPDDKAGLVNRIFAYITPTLAKVRTLKQTNIGLYKAIKHSVNLTITVIFFAMVYGVIKLVGNFIA
jgi:beta-hydroxylase